jgi:Mn-dependent DtxR family transcriptional regulator
LAHPLSDPRVINLNSNEPRVFCAANSSGCGVDAELSEETLRFLDQQIESLDHLEVLLLLVKEEARALEPLEVGSALGISPVRAARTLEELHGRGLIKREARAFRFGPTRARDAEAARRLASTYREERLAVIHAVSERALRRLRKFADAFRLRRDGGDD